MDNYLIEGKIGEGAHGVVLKAKKISSGTTVALKKVMIRRLEDGIPKNALREIKALQEIDVHENIVTLRSVFSQGNGFVLVFDYMYSDLSQVITNYDLTGAQIKSYMVMLLRGVTYCHDNHIMHRDLKPANLLIDSVGRLKIADFGLARVFGTLTDDGSRPRYSHQVATRWYRAPELLYGAREYTEMVDIWAVGTIMAEMINNSPIFPGENDIDQLACVFRVLGTPTAATWPDVDSLPDYNKITFEEMPAVPLEDVVANTTASAIDLLQKMIVLNATKRMTAHAALIHEYFFCEPLPAHHSELPVPAPKKSSEMDEPYGAGFKPRDMIDPADLPL
eukprot:m.134748 g.134748  ORF g.134748 m.134748 type:complete len:335 (+) comp22546_c1_seq2:281-1285(+)